MTANRPQTIKLRDFKLFGPSEESALRRNRNFILLFCAYGISAFGDHLSELGIMKEMGVEAGDEKTRIGALMMFCFFLPYVLLGPVAGAVADRLPRKWIMIAADIFRGLIAFSIPWYITQVDDPSSKLMLLPVLCLGLFACFFNPARLSFVPQVVADRHLTQANSLLNGLAPIAAIFSFIVGGWLAGHGWTKVNFYGDAATFGVSAFLILCILLPRSAQRQDFLKRSIVQDIAQGFAYIKSHRNVWQLMIFSATFWTVAGAFSSTIPTVVFDWYGFEEYWLLGVLRATLGAGMLIGAVILALVGDASRAHYNIIVALLGTGLMIMLFSLTSNPWIGGFLGVGVGLCGVWIIISAVTLLQRIVPNRTRGRVFGIVDLVNMSGMVLATGILGVFRIPHLDAQVDWILRGLAVVLMVMGVVVWRHHAGRSKYTFMVATVSCLNEVLCKFWYRLRRVGPCTIPPQGPCLVTSNHISGVDPSFMIAASSNRVFGFMIAKEYYNIPVWRHLIRQLECIPVRRDGNDIAATKQALRHLRRGKALGIFIQGGIPEPGRMAELRDGVAMLAMRTGVKVIPVHISGVKYHDAVIITYLLRHRVRVRFGPPVDLTEFIDIKDRRQVAGATQKIWQAIQDLSPENEPLYI